MAGEDNLYIARAMFSGAQMRTIRELSLGAEHEYQHGNASPTPFSGQAAA
jgi:hypothetical protein